MTSTGDRARHAHGRTWRLAAGVCTAGLLLTVGACSKDGGSAMAARATADAGVGQAAASTRPTTEPSTGVSTALPPDPSPATSTPSSPTSGDVPLLVGRRVTAVRAGLSFEVPAGWQAFDPSRVTKASAAALPQAAKDLARNSGLTVEEYLKQVGKAIEVMVMGPVRVGSADNISVIPTPTDELPTETNLRAQLESVGAKVVRVTRTATPIGPAVVAESRLPMATFVTHTRSVAVEHGGIVTYLTVTATTRAGAESLLRQILTSLKPA
ncbi:hypothetical protein [Terrabacter aerolatus]|nr:hypothetical protein [Terrabacter aerolatus]